MISFNRKRLLYFQQFDNLILGRSDDLKKITYDLRILHADLQRIFEVIRIAYK